MIELFSVCLDHLCMVTVGTFIISSVRMLHVTFSLEKSCLLTLRQRPTCAFLPVGRLGASVKLV